MGQELLLNMRILLGVVLAAGLVACGSDVETNAGNGGTTGAGGGSTTTTGAGGNTTTSTGTGGAATCGGIAGTLCAADEWCDYGNDYCGGEDGLGVCRTRPDVCSDGSVVCGCDGKTYASACLAQMQGFDVNAFGTCDPPVETFPCGPTFCDESTQYCRRTTSDVGGTPDGFQCVPLPAGCNGKVSCACLANEICGSICEDDAGGGAMVTCPGG
jgi:hypothetical protein